MNTNFDKICRACLMEKVNMRPIFDAFVADMLMACANVQILENDDLPHLICTQCLQQVNRSYSFKQLCEKSDSLLRKHLTESQYNKERKQTEQQNIPDNQWQIDCNGVTESKESVDYHIKTEQLKLEISEHLKLDVKQADDDNTWAERYMDEDEGEHREEEKISIVKNEECDNFECNECRKTFKGMTSLPCEYNR